jgi:hypothetical protein
LGDPGGLAVLYRIWPTFYRSYRPVNTHDLQRMAVPMRNALNSAQHA